jgi:Arc/MetJ-type ribon-helix-helix transcriptional regulator
MVRTQVQLTEQQLESLKRASAETGKSVAELVRLGVELYLDSQKKPDMRAIRERARLAAGKFSSGSPNNVSERHDEYLDEAFGDW